MVMIMKGAMKRGSGESLDNRRVVGRVKQLLMAAVCLLFAPVTFAEIGPYVGASVGNASSEVEWRGLAELKEDETAWKVIAGLNFDPILFDLAAEVAYVDFGAPSRNVLGGDLNVEMTAFTGFGLVGTDLGPIGVFGKFGLIQWDAKSRFNGSSAFSGSSDGTDTAYGIGARLELLSLEARVEYEVFDVDVPDADSSDFNMLSAGLIYRF